LIEFLPEDQRALAASKVRPTLWQAIRETANLIQGDASIKIPERPNYTSKNTKVKSSQLEKDTNILRS